MDSPQRRSRTPPYRYSDSPSPRRSSRGRSRSRTPPSRRDRSDVREDALNPGNNLYVTGLSTRVTEKDLDEHFSQEGKVVECRLVVDPRTRESRGFGFVTMDNADDADRCVKYLNRSTLEGRIITVEKLRLQFYQSLRVSWLLEAKRKRARTPTPGEYLGVRAAMQAHSRGYGGEYGGRNGGRDSYSDRRGGPRYSPYRGRDGRDRERSPRHSPYRGYRRERSRSPRYSPYRR